MNRQTQDVPSVLLKVLAACRRHGEDPPTASELSDGLNIRVERVRAALLKLERDGDVQRLSKRGRERTWRSTPGEEKAW